MSAVIEQLHSMDESKQIQINAVEYEMTMPWQDVVSVKIEFIFAGPACKQFANDLIASYHADTELKLVKF